MLRAENVAVRFGSIVAVDDVSVSISPGVVTAVIGPNAAGKSTLLRCMAGVFEPTSGAVLLDDQPVHRIRRRALARRVAYVTQRPSVAASFTVEEVVALGRYALEPDSGVIRDAMQQMDIADLADRVVPTLSVGQQQRVAIARALAQHQPGGVLILDEPTSALDMRHSMACTAELRRLAHEGSTVLLSVHDLSLAASIADEVLLLDAGRLVANGRADVVMTDNVLRPVFGVSFERLQRSAGGSVFVPAVDRR